MHSTSVGTPLLYTAFVTFVLVMLAVDLGVVRKNAREVGFREALVWSLVWVSLAALFNLWVYVEFGRERALEFLAGYLVEESLSVDNIFVFLVLFSYFAVPRQLQHRVLFYGILGALVMRAVFIFLGAELLERFHWMIYLFGGVLVVSGIKLTSEHGGELSPDRNPIVRLFRRLVPMVDTFRGERFFVRENGALRATPLCLVLVSLEFTDLMFALDSVPAIFAITKDPFIIFTSNIFAILGLRSLFFVLSGALGKIPYLRYGLAGVLIFVGLKMLASGHLHIPTSLSLGVIVMLIGGSVVASLLFPPRSPHTQRTP